MTSLHCCNHVLVGLLDSLDDSFDRFVEEVEQDLRSETAESKIVGFPFGPKHIREIEAVVTRMAFLGTA